MSKLYILRHAKSSWAMPGMGDTERELGERGVQQLVVASKWLAEQNIAPKKIICSPARRTIQTHDRICNAVGNPEMETISGLYNGMLDSYLDILVDQTDDDLMIIGHNPTCDELTRYLTAPSSPAAEKLMSKHFGTANLAIIDIPKTSNKQLPWTELSQSCGQLLQFVGPKDFERI